MATKQPSTLVEALNAFQQKHHAAGLDGSNPFYKSKYTTLAQALLAVQPATEFGLCHTQLNDYVITPEGEVITIDGAEWLKGAGQFNHLEMITDQMWDMFEMMRKKK